MRAKRKDAGEQGFTLVELIVVMIIIATLAAMAVPAYSHHIRVAKESVLREDLATMRQAIDSYTVDKQKAPQSKEDLVSSGYLKFIPKDPITGSSQTWTFDHSDTYSSVDETDTGINNVHSGAGGGATDGSSYNTW
ncbi:type II secretion system protein [Terriglobus sp.]|uniref:type II secretion system protein n=1 Tax=Terriglobus sp. TaxID=1889013 RepID=UPI003AFF6D6B